MSFLSLQVTYACFWFVSLAFGQVFVGTNRSEAAAPISIPPPGDSLSLSCNSTFTLEVTCDSNLPAIAFSGLFPGSDELATLCTLDCLQSLELTRNAQASSCSADIMVSSGDFYPVTATIDTLMWTYNYTCRRDATTGDFCSPIFDSWSSGNGSNDACSDCVLGTYQLQLGFGLGYDEELAASFTSLTSSCQATGYTVTSPPALTVNTTATGTATSTAPAAAKTCVSSYSVQDGDDCHSISESQRVSTSQLLYYNNLEGGCSNFPVAGEKLCMPHTCDIYTIKANDTCWGIAEAYNNTFGIAQLVSWNIDISNGCDNLELLVGNQICVSYPGDVSSVTATAPAPTATIAPIPSNVVDGTNTRCARYYQIGGGDTCAYVSNLFGISLPDLYFLNPEINSTSCNNLFRDYSYCVAAVGDIATYPGYGGSPTNPCVGGTVAGPASCYATTYVTAPEFTFPVLNTTSGPTGSTTATWSSHNITSVVADPTRTVSINPTPTPYQSGMVSGCTRFWKVVSTDSCYDLAQRWSIPLDTLYDWNPALEGDCTGLIAGEYICVQVGSTSTTGSSSVSSTSTAPSTTTTTTSAGNAPPGPTQTGIASDCNKWVMQQDGVYCYDMASNAGISLACLYQLNPALNTTAGECAGLWTGYAYCVGTVSNICK
ncbi:LysM domain-containing protein [Daldinia bambusicola]|nr:LysM domain-containing protein [Daldinia bambusicola]